MVVDHGILMIEAEIEIPALMAKATLIVEILRKGETMVTRTQEMLIQRLLLKFTFQSLTAKLAKVTSRRPLRNLVRFET